MGFLKLAGPWGGGAESAPLLTRLFLIVEAKNLVHNSRLGLSVDFYHKIWKF